MPDRIQNVKTLDDALLPSKALTLGVTLNEQVYYCALAERIFNFCECHYDYGTDGAQPRRLLPAGFLDLNDPRRDATSTNIADYNNFVTAVANDVPELALLGTTWTVIGSTATVDARDNTGTNLNVATGAPIYLLNDTKLADSNSDLWDGTIDTAFEVNEFGNTVATVNMWTGTSPDGTENVGFALGTVSAIYGNSSITTGWILQGQAATSAARPLYAISGNLIAPIPIPAALWLFGSAIGLLGWMRRKAS